MKPKVESVALLAALGMLTSSALSQKQAPQQNMTVVVVNAHVQPSKPLQAVRVSLSYLDGASRITDARDLTNSHGEAILHVSPDTAQRGDIRVEITGVTDLVIYQPADGQLSAVPSTVTVQLLPKGSPALLGPSQIEAILHRSVLQVNSLQKQNHVLKEEVAGALPQKKDLNDALSDWAKANGFPPTEVDQHVQQWAQDIQAKSARATEEQKALAELALKHYGAAAGLFEKAADADAAGLDSAEQQFLKAQHDKLRQLLSDTKQAAGAFQFNLQFHAATTALERARDRAAAEHKKFPEDPGIDAIWLESIHATATARTQEGIVSAADQSLPLLVQAVTDYQSLATEYERSGDRESWAGTENDLGHALGEEGARATSDKAMPLLNQAAGSFLKAQQVFTKADHPKEWASIQTNMGAVLVKAGRTSSGDRAEPLLDHAVLAYQGALEIYTKSDSPEQWAAAQSNLGLALLSQSKDLAGDQATSLLTRAVQADQSALEIFTKADHPRDWADTQFSLGLALLGQSQHTTGDQFRALLKQALQAFQNTLDVYTQADLPQQWAATQNSLGLVYLYAARTSDKEHALPLFQQSSLAFQNSLKVYTQADLPQQWAEQKKYMGQIFIAAGRLETGDKAQALFSSAVQNFQAALQVYTKASLPQQWAGTQNDIGNVYLGAGRIATDDQAGPLLDHAAQSYQRAIEIYTKDNFPQQWAGIQNNLGAALNREAEHSSQDKASALLDQAINAMQRSLEVYTKTAFPLEWGRTQNNLALAHAAQGNYPAALTDYENALEVDHSPVARLNLASANLRAAHFDVCAQQAAAIDTTQLQPAWALLHQSFKMACQWAAGDKTSALQTEKSLAAMPPVTAPASVFGWNPYGTLHFVSTSPTFATNRPAWLALFTALKNGDPPAMTAALHQLEPLMQN